MGSDTIAENEGWNNAARLTAFLTTFFELYFEFIIHISLKFKNVKLKF